ncbi:MAG TPA: HisA/HisF-related TIM barrel protein [Gemmatimonadaceae bacterium]|jgi:phosphoribosylformimino-5-aminoimidazole carboxamide ribotide isomerase
MIAIPAIDLHDAAGPSSSSVGRVRFGYSDEVLHSLSDLGFRRIHVMEDAGNSNLSSVEHILGETSANVQVAGVSSASEIEQLLRVGVDYVVVGSRGLDEPEWLADMADLYPGSLGVATDVRDRRVVRRGWVRTLPVDILDVVDELNNLPLRELVVTVRASEEGLGMTELALLEDVAEQSRFCVSVAGGVGSINDLRALEHRGISSAVIDAARFLDGALDGRQIAHEFGA